MRGKALHAVENAINLRITPAYAGKSPCTYSFGLVTRDHPRLCGEKSNFAPRFFQIFGSPPPMRGKAMGLFDYLRQRRITPAYAGKSLTAKHQKAVDTDHPRLCGEKSFCTTR